MGKGQVPEVVGSEEILVVGRDCYRVDGVIVQVWVALLERRVQTLSLIFYLGQKQLIAAIDFF